ncbi:tryptophan-rich sensory protein [Nocardioides sp. J2M5]|uniref:TspO/MBR family protein n=1 Tax=Nocardioides palaemonis TaxID=2829810 RepID=UPI001BA4DD0D|nr:tryptophan-rich sensory protein [Nocardioides palaemonis]MBS2936676.1 tryptophan-rich sensory protein [Nocardioides palaemonis]
MSLAASLTWTGVVVAYAVLANAWNNRDPGWYDHLDKPSFQPPTLVFALVWPLNFALLVLVGLAVVRTAEPGAAWAATGVLAVSVACALTWARLFYVPPHRLTAAARWLTAAAVLTWLLAVVVGAMEVWGGLVLLPYALWLSFATALAHAYARGPRSVPGR